jgi:hypothetical protein
LFPACVLQTLHTSQSDAAAALLDMLHGSPTSFHAASLSVPDLSVAGLGPVVTACLDKASYGEDASRSAARARVVERIGPLNAMWQVCLARQITTNINERDSRCAGV